MIQMPLDPQDRTWLFARLIVLGLVVMIHPLPFDLRRFGLVIPAHSADLAYVVFECLQTVVFAAALFFGDMLPGMRWVSAYWATVEIREASWREKLLKPWPLVIGSALVSWLILTPVETIVKAVPPGSPRFCAATAYFIIERLVVVLTFVMIVNANDDDDEPGARRRSIAAEFAKLLRIRRGRAVARAPVTTS